MHYIYILRLNVTYNHVTNIKVSRKSFKRQNTPAYFLIIGNIDQIVQQFIGKMLRQISVDALFINGTNRKTERLL